MDTIARCLTIDNNYLSIDDLTESDEEAAVNKALCEIRSNEVYDYYISECNSKRGADRKRRFTLQRFMAE